MTLKQAIKIVGGHQKWRRGDKGKMANPTELGEALDVLLVVANDYMRVYNMDRVKIKKV